MSEASSVVDKAAAAVVMLVLARPLLWVGAPKEILVLFHSREVTSTTTILDPRFLSILSSCHRITDYLILRLSIVSSSTFPASNPYPFIMLSGRVLIASRFLRAHRTPVLRYPFPVVQQFRNYADKIVKVPEMAESISEGTLKQWSKQIGDYVEQDEEIATIETDKVRSFRPDCGFY